MKTNAACPQLAEYEELATGRLSPLDKEAVLDHLEGCIACVQRIESLSEKDTLVDLIRQARTLGEGPPGETVARLVEQLRKLRPRAEALTLAPASQGGAGSSSGTKAYQGTGQTQSASKALYDFLAPAQAPDELGRLGPYRVLKVLGAGGMGVVFQAEDPQLQRIVALKAMLPSLAASDSAKQRFLREARAAAALKHDHIVTIHQVGEDRGAPFLAMEFLEGQPLDERLEREGKLPVADVLRIGREMAEGLAAAHERGLIHRDIKPANVWLDGKTGRVKILDFGLARASTDAAHLTQPGAIVGTPAYMAPEQGQSKTVDPRSDLFSLGCVLYRMATGEAPFKGSDIISTLMAVATETPRPPQVLEPGLPKALSDLIVILLAKHAAERPASAQVVAEKLDRIAQATAPSATPGKPSKRWPAVAAAAAFLALAAAGMVLFMQTPDGVVRIEIDDPDVKLAIEGHTATITNADKQTITLKPGTHGLTITRGDFTFNTASFEMPRRGKTALKITWQAGMVVMQDGSVIGAKPAPVSVAERPLPPRFKNSLGMEFALVPKGKAWLGGGSERPGHKAYEVKDDFYLGVYEVTQEEWERVTRLKPSHFSRTGPGKDAVKDIADAELKRFPVENISRDDARLFLARLNERSKQAGWAYRLPTNAEWEYACRGGPVDRIDSAFDFYFDEPTTQLLPAQANYKHENNLNRTSMVGSYAPNRLGLYDMHGNVWEWCDDDLQGHGVVNALIRGGFWNGEEGFCRACNNFGTARTIANYGHGLRVARVPVGAVISQGNEMRQE